MVAVYSHGWTADQTVVDAYGAPLFYVHNEYDLARMFAINPSWRCKEQRIRAIANLPIAQARHVEPDLSAQAWRDVGRGVEIYDGR